MTLVEQLVTLVLISVGLLGIAALQVSGLAASKDTYKRLRASSLAENILERIRANPLGCLEGQYTAGFNDSGPEGTTARMDLSAWQAEIDSALPGGATRAAGAILCAEDSDMVKVIIRWSENESSTQNMPTFEVRTEI